MSGPAGDVMRTGAVRRVTLALAGVVVLAGSLGAHHEILAKFDDKKPVTLNGVVTLVDWKNPHVHIFINVKDRTQVLNWAIELESPIDLQKSGWKANTVQPGDALTVDGLAARNGSRQAWGRAVTLTGGRRVFTVTASGPPP